ncbi:MAG: hypothetical protein IPM50_06590 [Acidobacteriota bacterium]|nr:MAG: hypothetical protein IPM50_06590 [Acidobacteriota bacterium]
MRRTAILMLIAVSFALNSFAQAPAKPEYDEATKKLRAEAANMLRETAGELTRLRLAENRISFAAELAGLMWLHDENEARAMYQGAISDMRILLLQLDQQMAIPDMTGADDGISGGLFGRAFTSPVERKFRIAMGVRRQIALSLADHDADLAYDFFYNSLAELSNSEMKRDIEKEDKYFEFQFLKRIADADAEKALRYGKRSLADGVEAQHLEILRSIYKKDADKGAEFGAEILAKLKQTKVDDLSHWTVSVLLDFGAATLEDAGKKKKKPVYSRGDLREIADILANIYLTAKDEAQAFYAAMAIEKIEKFNPSRAGQLRSKFRNEPSFRGGAANAAVNAAMTAAIAANAAITANATNTAPVDPRVAIREEREAEWQNAWENVGKLANKELPKEDRQAAIDEARRIIERTSSPQAKVTGLTMLAGVVAKAGDKELALQLMNEAERFSNPYPKTYVDYMMTWMLASGMAEVEPERAFRQLESAIFRLNDTIAAAVKIAEFIDVNDEIIEEGELHVGSFGGSLIRDVTRDLRVATPTLKTLAAADMAKTKALAETFDRQELRFLAKMMVLRAVLDDRPLSEGDDKTDEAEEGVK